MLEKINARVWNAGRVMIIVCLATAWLAGWASQAIGSTVLQYVCWASFGTVGVAIGVIMVIGAVFGTYNLYQWCRWFLHHHRQRHLTEFTGLIGTCLLITGVETVEASMPRYLLLVAIVTVIVGVIWITDHLPLRQER